MKRPSRRTLRFAVTAWCALAVAGASAAAAQADRGAVGVFAPVFSPGYPALPHVVGDRVYEGTYANPQGDALPSRVFQYSAGGVPLRSYTVPGQTLSQPHGVQVAATDAQGRLLLLDRTSGRILRLDPSSGEFTQYARVPDLPLCAAALSGAECSPALLDQAPMPDYAAWGPDGSLYVTDYQQAVIWRVPPGGGTPHVWLADRRLDGGPFGTACIVMSPDRHTLLFDQASNGGLGGTNASTGKLYAVAIEPGGGPGALRQLWESGAGDAPDGCALDEAGHIYIALVGAANQVVELDADGNEITRFGQVATGANGGPVPFDSPSGVAFLGSDLLIANQSYFSGTTANQVILSLDTGGIGAPVYVPARAGLGPAPAPPPRHRRSRHRRHRSALGRLHRVR